MSTVEIVYVQRDIHPTPQNRPARRNHFGFRSTSFHVVLRNICLFYRLRIGLSAANATRSAGEAMEGEEGQTAFFPNSVDEDEVMQDVDQISLQRPVSRFIVRASWAAFLNSLTEWQTTSFSRQIGKWRPSSPDCKS